MAWSVDQQPISSNIAGTQQTSASFTLFPVITTSPSVPQAIRYTAGTWRIARDTGEDSIGLAVKALNTLVARSGGNGEDRNPVLSTGVNHGPIRVWSVWQNNAGGRWKLFGSYADIILDDVKEGGIVNAFHLHQNYPNPFNPSTTISFELKRPAHVLLKVFDILGREVATLTDERKDLGLHKVGLASRALGTGVYFYRLSVDGYQQTRKMIVVK